MKHRLTFGNINQTIAGSCKLFAPLFSPRDGTSILHTHQVPLTSKCPGGGWAVGMLHHDDLPGTHISSSFFQAPTTWTDHTILGRAFWDFWYSIFSIDEPAMTNFRLQRFSHLDIIYFSDRRGDIHIYLHHLLNITLPTFHEGVLPFGLVTT